MAIARRYLVVALLFTAGGCGLEMPPDSSSGPPASSGIEVVQSSLDPPFGCSHELCHADWSSPPLVAGCGMYSCTASICLTYHDPYRCSTNWDPVCVGEVFSICHRRCDCASICAKGE